MDVVGSDPNYSILATGTLPAATMNWANMPIMNWVTERQLLSIRILYLGGIHRRIRSGI
jgi:hypothetical protein